MEQKALLYHVIFTASILWPAFVICRRAGIHPLWVVTLCVPVFGVMLYACALAVVHWPQASDAGAV